MCSDLASDLASASDALVDRIAARSTRVFNPDDVRCQLESKDARDAGDELRLWYKPGVPLGKHTWLSSRLLA